MRLALAVCAVAAVFGTVLAGAPHGAGRAEVADLSVVWTSAPSAVAGGDHATATLVATNNGPTDATAHIDVTSGSVIAANTTDVACEVGPVQALCTGLIPAGGTVEIHVTFGVGLDVPGPFVADVDVYSETTDPNGGNNHARFTATVRNVANLGVSQDAPTTAETGNTMTFTLRVGNMGPSPALNTEITDEMPAATSFVSVTQVDGADNARLRATCRIDERAFLVCTIPRLAAGGFTSYRLQVRAEGPVDSTFNTLAARADDAARAFDMARLTITGTARVDVAVSLGPSSVTAPEGGRVQQVVAVHNLGDTSVSVAVTVGSDPAAWHIYGDNGCGESLVAPPRLVCTFQVPPRSTVTAPFWVAPAPGQFLHRLNLTAEATTGVPDDNLSNNTAHSDVGVWLGQSSTAFTAAILGPDSVNRGDPVTYSYALTTRPYDPVHYPTWSFQLPAGVQFTSLEPPGGGYRCSEPSVETYGGVITCTAPITSTAHALIPREGTRVTVRFVVHGIAGRVGTWNAWAAAPTGAWAVPPGVPHTGITVLSGGAAEKELVISGRAPRIRIPNAVPVRLELAPVKFHWITQDRDSPVLDLTLDNRSDDASGPGRITIALPASLELYDPDNPDWRGARTIVHRFADLAPHSQTHFHVRVASTNVVDFWVAVASVRLDARPLAAGSVPSQVWSDLGYIFG